MHVDPNHARHSPPTSVAAVAEVVAAVVVVTHLVAMRRLLVIDTCSRDLLVTVAAGTVDMVLTDPLLVPTRDLDRTYLVAVTVIGTIATVSSLLLRLTTYRVRPINVIGKYRSVITYAQLPADRRNACAGLLVARHTTVPSRYSLILVLAGNRLMLSLATPCLSSSCPMPRTRPVLPYRYGTR